MREHQRRLITTDQGVGISTVSRTGFRPVAFLFVHGLASNARLWDGVADHLASKGYRSVALDQRSRGQSDRVEGPFDFATLSDNLLSVIDRSFLPIRRLSRLDSPWEAMWLWNWPPATRAGSQPWPALTGGSSP